MNVNESFNSIFANLTSSQTQTDNHIVKVTNLSAAAHAPTIMAIMLENGNRPIAVMDEAGRRGIVFKVKDHLACAFERYCDLEVSPIVCYYVDSVDEEDGYVWTVSFLMKDSVESYGRSSNYKVGDLDDRVVHEALFGTEV